MSGRPCTADTPSGHEHQRKPRPLHEASGEAVVYGICRHEPVACASASSFRSAAALVGGGGGGGRGDKPQAPRENGTLDCGLHCRLEIRVSPHG